jgi:hypothetical protein
MRIRGCSVQEHTVYRGASQVDASLVTQGFWIANFWLH